MAKEQTPSSSHVPMFIALFVLISFVFVILLQGQKIKNPLTFPKPQKEEPVSTQVFSIVDRQMDIPNKWEMIGKTPTEIFLMIKDSSTKEQLTLSFISKNEKSTVELYKNKKVGNNYIKTSTGEIFNINCSDSFVCSGAIVNDDVYLFNWQKTSNTSKPPFSAGTWTPPTPDITTDDVWEILKTIR